MKKTASTLFTIFSFLLIANLTPLAFAQRDCNGPNCFINIGGKQGSGAIPGIKAVGNPNATPGNLVSNVILILYAVGGMAVLLFIVWGAFDWITSGGDKEKVAGARKKITNSLIGLAILSLAAFIVSLFGQVVGIDPTKMGILPTLDQPPP